jgi:hypothetical protein
MSVRVNQLISAAIFALAIGCAGALSTAVKAADYPTGGFRVDRGDLESCRRCDAPWQWERHRELESRDTIVEPAPVERRTVIERRTVVERPAIVERRIVQERPIIVERPPIVEKRVIVEAPPVVHRRVFLGRPAIVERAPVIVGRAAPPVAVLPGPDCGC